MIEGIQSFFKSMPLLNSPPTSICSFSFGRLSVWVRERWKEIIIKAEEHRMNELGIFKKYCQDLSYT